MVLGSYGCCCNLIWGQHPTIKKRKRQEQCRLQTASVRSAAIANNTSECWVFEISILLISFRWLRRYSSADKFVQGTERKWNDADFSYFTKTCLKLQCGICSPRQMHIKWNWTMNSRLLSAQCLRGKYITNEFYREEIWTFSITVIPIESLS